MVLSVGPPPKLLWFERGYDLPTLLDAGPFTRLATWTDYSFVSEFC